MTRNLLASHNPLTKRNLLLGFQRKLDCHLRDVRGYISPELSSLYFVSDKHFVIDASSSRKIRHSIVCWGFQGLLHDLCLHFKEYFNVLNSY